MGRVASLGHLGGMENAAHHAPAAHGEMTAILTFWARQPRHQGGFHGRMVVCSVVLGVLPPATWTRFCRANYFIGMLGGNRSTEIKLIESV